MIKLVKTTFYKEKETKQKLCDFIKKTKQLSFGPECEKFEKNFAKWQGRKHCIFLNSGSSANLAIIQTLLNLNIIKRGDNIGFSALTWSTNVMPLIQLGLTSIPIDISLETLNVSSAKLLQALKRYPIKMLFLTNLLGFCDNIDVIEEICRKRRIFFIEDNCESLGTVYKGKKLGNYGLASTFSFYVGHHMSTIEGGAVCTDSEEVANMLRIVRAHGWERNVSIKRKIKIRNENKINSTFYSRYAFYDLGYNLRPTEIAGFIGNTQIPYLNEVTKIRHKNFFKMAVPIYKQTNKYHPIKFDHIDFLSDFAVPVVCRSQKVRDILVEKCNGKIEIRPIVGGDTTRQPFFNKYMKKFSLKNSNAKLVHTQGLYFGNNPNLTNKEMSTIIKVFTDFND